MQSFDQILKSYTAVPAEFKNVEEQEEIVVSRTKPIIVRREKNGEISSKTWFKKPGKENDVKKEVLASILLSILIGKNKVAKCKIFEKSHVLSQKIGFSKENHQYKNICTIGQYVENNKELFQTKIEKNDKLAKELAKILLCRIIIGDTDSHWNNIMIDRDSGELFAIDFDDTFHCMHKNYRSDNTTLLLFDLKPETIAIAAKEIIHEFDENRKQLYKCMNVLGNCFKM